MQSKKFLKQTLNKNSLNYEEPSLKFKKHTFFIETSDDTEQDLHMMFNDILMFFLNELRFLKSFTQEYFHSVWKLVHSR